MGKGEAVGLREFEWWNKTQSLASAGLIDVQLTLEYLQAHSVLLITQHWFNSNACWQRQKRRCLVNCRALCPDFSFISLSTWTTMMLSVILCLHGNYVAFCAVNCLNACIWSACWRRNAVSICCFLPKILLWKQWRLYLCNKLQEPWMTS